jgi:hypothetical protein
MQQQQQQQLEAAANAGAEMQQLTAVVRLALLVQMMQHAAAPMLFEVLVTECWCVCVCSIHAWVTPAAGSSTVQMLKDSGVYTSRLMVCGLTLRGGRHAHLYTACLTNISISVQCPERHATH